MSTAPMPRLLPPPAALIERFHVRGLVVIGLVILAYHYSFLSVGRGLALQTPLAYLGLVPLMAAALAWATVRGAPPAPAINDRQVDYIIGLGLIVGAGAIAALSPRSLGAEFWNYRIDLLSLPLFAAGLVAIFFGVRRAWLLRWPFAFLLLAWPVPYLPLLGESTRASVEVTVAILSQLSALTPWASQVPGFGSDVFAVQHDGGSFLVSVTAACSGINSLLGFGLVGLAVTAVLRGSLRARAIWLVSGLLLMLVLNVVRIEAILAVGAVLGPEAALQGLHPVAGLIAFNLGLIVMLVLSRRFRLVLPPSPGAERAHRRITSHVTSIRGALIVGIVVAAIFGTINQSYAHYEASRAPDSGARVPLDISQSQLRGWDVAGVASYDQASGLFGSGSTWERVRYQSSPLAALQSDRPLFLDIITTGDSTILGAYGIQATYPFPGYDVVGRTSARIGDGRDATVISYRHPVTDRSWSIASWITPTQDAEGAARFERVTVLLPDSEGAVLRGSLQADFEPTGDEMERAERFIVAVARLIELTSGIRIDD